MKLLAFILLTAMGARAQSSSAGTWSSQGSTGTAQLALISISLTPSSSSQASGLGVTFIAIATFSDGSTQNVTSSAIWSSSNTSVAMIGTPGSSQNVSCLSPGTTTVGAVIGPVSGTAALTCSNAMSGENAYCTGTTDSSCFVGNVNDGPAALPTSGIETDLANTPAPGSVVTLACGANLQNAINALSAGQTLVVPAMCSGVQNSYTGNFTLPVVSGANSTTWNWIETDQTSNANFPPEHTRATPCAINKASVAGYPSYPCASPAFLMPQIQCANSSNQACLTANTGAHYWRVIGVELLQPGSFNNDGNGLVDLTNGSDHFILDRSIGHGQPLNCPVSGGVYGCTSKDLKNGVQLQNSTNVAVINSWLYDIHCPQGTCTDAHAFGGGNGTLPSHTYKLYNNMIAAAGENFIQGGSGAAGATNIVTPTDFEIRNNHFFKPVEYALCTGCSGGGHVPEPKNDFEIKNASRLLIEGNEFENNYMGWNTDQSGYDMVIGARNQNGDIFLTASSDGAGNLTATSGSFGTGAGSPVSSLCASAGHCMVTVGNTVTTAQTQTDSTHISVSPAPAVGTFSIDQCTAGLNPNAIATDLTIRYNEFRNSTNGPEFATVTSDCNDPSLGLTRFTLHDNLIQGINNQLNNGSTGNGYARCTFVLNAESATITNYVIEHNTCAIASAGNFGYSGLDAASDLEDSTTDGSTGAYISNRTIRNNIGPMGGMFTYTNGLYPGGALAGLKQQSCTPAVTGSTCTWIYTENILGTGQWNNQLSQAPFPSTNQTCGNSGSPSATCFPNGSAFTNLFTSYNGPSGQPGYLGTYSLSPNGPYNGAGTDGLDVGVSNWATFNSKLNGVRSNTIYTAASITTTSLPNATHGVAYSQQLAGTSASDMQVWSITNGTLPSGLTLSRAGLISGTPSAAGSATFTLQMMDAAQQYASQTITLTVQ